ncbi:hypothetical protein [Alsobacter sp. R-9]
MPAHHAIWSTFGALKVAAIRGAVLGALALAAVTASEASAAPAMPGAAAPLAAAPAVDHQDGNLLEQVQWGPPYGRAYGHRRHWREPGWRHRPGWGRPYYRCRTVWERRYDPWRGWRSYPVRRCW